jgi:hypothetical protein
MKNIFKSRFSLIAICIVLGILIGSFALCGCRTNYGLLEGMAVEEEKKKKVTQEPIAAVTEGAALKEGATGDTNLTTVSEGGKPSLNPASVLEAKPMGVGDIAGSLAGIGSSLETDGANAITSSIAKALSTINPIGIAVPQKKDTDAFSTNKEGFQMSKPLAWGPIKDTEAEDVNLTKWVSDAMRYSKGMGNENHLDSYQYNSGPPIPLPEGEMFFFKNTKFDTSCCPGTYTNSLGCACMSKKQFQYLTMRGGNNTVPDTKTSYYNEF